MGKVCSPDMWMALQCIWLDERSDTVGLRSNLLQLFHERVLQGIMPPHRQCSVRCSSDSIRVPDESQRNLQGIYAGVVLGAVATSALILVVLALERYFRIECGGITVPTVLSLCFLFSTALPRSFQVLRGVGLAGLFFHRRPASLA